jgi:hypothetical protein
MQKKPRKDQARAQTPARGKKSLHDLAPAPKQAKEVKGGAANLNLSKSNVN